MYEVVGNSTITIIQGDSYDRQIAIENVASSLIKKIVFSCKDLNIEKELSYDEEKDLYLLHFSSEETQLFSGQYSSYDLTIFFTDNNVQTIVYQGTIKILSKTNVVSE